MLREDFPDLATAHLGLQSGPGFVARVASYAAKVDALAASDRVSANILDKAAAHLSEAVQAAGRADRTRQPARHRCRERVRLRPRQDPVL